MATAGDTVHTQCRYLYNSMRSLLSPSMWLCRLLLFYIYDEKHLWNSPEHSKVFIAIFRNVDNIQPISTTRAVPRYVKFMRIAEWKEKCFRICMVDFIVCGLLQKSHFYNRQTHTYTHAIERRVCYRQTMLSCVDVCARAIASVFVQLCLCVVWHLSPRLRCSAISSS